jgi:hypothetical protein
MLGHPKTISYKSTLHPQLELKTSSGKQFIRKSHIASMELFAGSNIAAFSVSFSPLNALKNVNMYGLYGY